MWPSRRGRRKAKLRELDYLALTVGIGFLLALFRHSERWLHQHIFKVGWLLSNDYQATTLVYYILFLPGILLHELTLWLAAGILRVRAERALAFPQAQDIGELRLNFIRLSPQASPSKLRLIALMPLLAGLAALWLISEHVFAWSAALELAAAGTLDALAQAIAALTGVADFWLWFYLAFTIANTTFPAWPKPFSRRQKTFL